MTRDQLRRIVATRMRLDGSGSRRFLRKLKMKDGHHTNLNRFLSGEKPPTPALLKALGYKRIEQEYYVPAK